MTSPLPGRTALSRCRDEARFWRNYALLYRYAVRVDREAELYALVKSRIPTQRRPPDLWPTPRPVPPGLPSSSRIRLPRRTP